MGIVFLAVIGFGLMVEIGIFPSISVIDGNKLPEGDLEFLIDEGIISPDEEVQLFYSTGLISIVDEGNLLTDKRIVSYERIDGQLTIYSSLIENISDIEVIQDGDFFNDTIIEIWTVDGDGFLLLLSTEDGGDKKFINKIKGRIGQSSDTAFLPVLRTGVALAVNFT